uniref:Enolase-phosphatase E1-like n=1 Tax=Saccoglossus kowalevskii TaxID=10224 RepID=A0ABM0MWS4_SACKO|nr:PREDICTED: enolase-phosphatase E1-like [Saccoglossus kowalevskii]
MSECNTSMPGNVVSDSEENKALEEEYIEEINENPSKEKDDKIEKSMKKTNHQDKMLKSSFTAPKQKKAGEDVTVTEPAASEESKPKKRGPKKKEGTNVTKVKLPIISYSDEEYDKIFDAVLRRCAEEGFSGISVATTNKPVTQKDVQEPQKDDFDALLDEDVGGSIGRISIRPGQDVGSLLRQDFVCASLMRASMRVRDTPLGSLVSAVWLGQQGEIDTGGKKIRKTYPPNQCRLPLAVVATQAGNPDRKRQAFQAESLDFISVDTEIKKKVKVKHLKKSMQDNENDQDNAESVKGNNKGVNKCDEDTESVVMDDSDEDNQHENDTESVAKDDSDENLQHENDTESVAKDDSDEDYKHGEDNESVTKNGSDEEDTEFVAKGDSDEVQDHSSGNSDVQEDSPQEIERMDVQILPQPAQLHNDLVTPQLSEDDTGKTPTRPIKPVVKKKKLTNKTHRQLDLTFQQHENTDKEKKDEDYNSCTKPQVKNTDEIDAEYEFVFTRYTIGSLVWAKMQGYPWWPGLLEEDPDTRSFYETDGVSRYPAKYHVVFFGDNVSRAWVRSTSVEVFTGKENVEDFGSPKMKGKNYTKEVKKAQEIAMKAMSMTLKERVMEYGFSRFKGPWGADSQDSQVSSQLSVSNGISSKTPEVDTILRTAESVLDEAESMIESIEDSLNDDDDDFVVPKEKKHKKQTKQKKEVSQNEGGTKAVKRKLEGEMMEPKKNLKKKKKSKDEKNDDDATDVSEKKAKKDRKKKSSADKSEITDKRQIDHEKINKNKSKDVKHTKPVGKTVAKENPSKNKQNIEKSKKDGLKYQNTNVVINKKEAEFKMPKKSKLGFKAPGKINKSEMKVPLPCRNDPTTSEEVNPTKTNEIKVFDSDVYTMDLDTQPEEKCDVAKEKVKKNKAKEMNEISSNTGKLAVNGTSKNGHTKKSKPKFSIKRKETVTGKDFVAEPKEKKPKLILDTDKREPVEEQTKEDSQDFDLDFDLPLHSEVIEPTETCKKCNIEAIGQYV